MKGYHVDDVIIPEAVRFAMAHKGRPWPRVMRVSMLERWTVKELP